MKKYLAGLAIAAALGLMTTGTAWTETQTPRTRTIAALQRRVDWQAQHIRQLNHRRAYLHRYIRHLRNPSAPTAQSTDSPTQTYATGGWADELRAVGFPESAIPTMLAIIQRESGGNPNAVNPTSGACGLTQLYPCYGGSAWLDPMTNLRLAFQKYQAAGFAPWA